MRQPSAAAVLLQRGDRVDGLAGHQRVALVAVQPIGDRHQRHRPDVHRHA